MATTYQLLGVVDGKEYHLDLRKTIKQAGVEAPNPDFGKVVFRVPDIREGIHAEPGMKILCCDYSQIEVRLMAFLSGDPKLKAALNKGGDIHCYTAVDCFGQEYGFDYEQISKGRKNEADPRFLLFKALRSKTKAVTFGTPYGAGPPRIAAQCNEGKRPDDPSFMTIDQAAELIARFFSKYPVLKAWLEQQGRDAIRYGYTTSTRGRKRFYMMPAQDDKDRDQQLSQIKRWAGNHPIQASNVDMLKPAMRRMYDGYRARGWTWEDARILFVVHDEIVATAREEIAEEARYVQWEAMKWAFDRIIPDIVSSFEDKLADDGHILKPGTDSVTMGDIWIHD